MPAESAVPPVTFGVKVTKDIGHVHFDVFAGRTPHSRGNCGSLVMRPEEYEEFIARLQPGVIHYVPGVSITPGRSGSENTDG